ncbi:adenylyl-sulfate kinase [Cohnella abietis]|uniref:Adenylyl-sulfate kinase n=1 Tax=Cohnella abietis TaxID=2507935 RepID=A0A3T1DC52_9BACL|nr:adenylyl-sulfate kinase [Cohnella abietis]BBI35677.1 adenylyl-sulfate kinase [Cohnella abietis]
MEPKSANITWQHSTIKKEDRNKLNKHKSRVLWFTGLSGSGKSTLAFALEQQLFRRHYRSYVLDGDNIRHGINRDLGFSPQDRTENIRRIGEVAKLMVDAGLIVIAAFISPYEQDRSMVRTLFADGEFIEVFIDCPIEECERRDVKGLYKKALAGEIPNFTGVSAPYEIPQNPDIIIDTSQLSIGESVRKIMDYLD